MPDSPSAKANSDGPNNPSKLERLVEISNKLLQIAAIIAAGLWALWTWHQLTAPSLKTGLNVSGSISDSLWDAPSKACMNDVTVAIENLGQRNIEIARVEYEVSRAKPTHLDSTDVIKIEDAPPQSAELLQHGRLDSIAGWYPPKVKRSWTLVVFVSRNPDEKLWLQAKAFDHANNLLDFWFTSWIPCQDERRQESQRD